MWLLTLWLAFLPNTAPPAVLSGRPRPTSMAAPWLAAGPAEPKSPQQLRFELGTKTTNYWHASASQVLNIELVAKRLNGVEVLPGRVFNYYRVVGPYTQENGYGWGRGFVGDRIVPSVGGGVCQGASTLYAAILRTGLKVIERHQHGLTVPYLPPGEDATVAGDYLNFQFQNTRTTPIMITAQADQRLFTISIWGASPGPSITVHHRILERYPFRTLIQVNPNLKSGEEKVLTPGQEGVLVHTWLEVVTPQGIERRDLGNDRYRPSPRIVQRSSLS